jgi:UDP-N-acetylglucosamine--N-acetylmuramyl-(pentapeptide) pyrophosphoryl-undecaprenol N-acetylglucosamine transferase
LAVASALDHAGNVRVAYVGSPDGMEGDLVRRESALPFYAIDAAAVRGRSPIALVRNVVRLLRGVVQAIQLVRRERPVAIFGTGGYVCVPLFVAAWLMRIPRAIYLPDVVPGLAVRMLSRLATVTLGSIPDAAPYLQLTAVHATDWHGDRRQLAVAGYPVRTTIHLEAGVALRQQLNIPTDMPLMLVYGGSRGARSVNLAVAALLPHILPHAHVLHVCGREGDESMLVTYKQQLPAELQARYHLYPYLAADGAVTMTAALAAADFTVCRSGASVLGELPAAQLPAILVPYPYVHQDENADYLVRHQAALKVSDTRLAQDLLPAVMHLMTDTTARNTMRTAMASLARPDAAMHMAKLLQRISKG